MQHKFDIEHLSWNSAMDEVRTERLVETHKDNALLVMLRDWPISKDYVTQPELVASLEQQVCSAGQICTMRGRRGEGWHRTNTPLPPCVCLLVFISLYFFLFVNFIAFREFFSTTTMKTITVYVQ